MQKEIATLIVSGRAENRERLSGILASRSMCIFIVSTVAHARELLQVQPIAIVFCDERLSDGTYHEVVRFAKAQHKNMEFIVVLSTGEWPEFLEALGMGVDVIRYPFQPTDIDLVLIRAIRRDLLRANLSYPQLRTDRLDAKLSSPCSSHSEPSKETPRN